MSTILQKLDLTYVVLNKRRIVNLVFYFEGETCYLLFSLPQLDPRGLIGARTVAAHSVHLNYIHSLTDVIIGSCCQRQLKAAFCAK